MNTQPMSKKKIFLIVSLFLVALTVSRVFWVIHFQAPEYVQAQKGVIDFSGWTFTDKQTLNLDGEWEFYPNDFIEPSIVGGSQRLKDKRYIQVPGNWTESFHSNGQKTVYGHGTYCLRIQLPKNDQQIYGLRFKDIRTAATAYVEGKQIAKYNTANETSEKMQKNSDHSMDYFQRTNKK